MRSYLTREDFHESFPNLSDGLCDDLYNLFISWLRIDERLLSKERRCTEMLAWSEVLEARTNERGDLIARIRPEISRGLRNQWYKFDEEVQYSIVAEMLEPYGFRKGAGWYNWVFIKDGAKFQMMQNDVTQLQDGHWIFVSRVELAQWEKEHVEKHWGLFSGALDSRNNAIEKLDTQEMPRVKEPTIEHLLPPFQLDEGEDYEEKDDWSWFDDSDLPF